MPTSPGEGFNLHLCLPSLSIYSKVDIRPHYFVHQDMRQQPPTQELVAKDLLGVEWRFRHIFRGNDSYCSKLFV